MFEDPTEDGREAAPAEPEQSMLSAISDAVDSAEVEHDAEPTEKDEADESEAAEAEAAPEGEQKPEGDKPAEPPAAEAEEDLTEVPADLKGRTRERFEKLTTTLKQTREEAAQAVQYAERWRETIESTKAPPEFIGQALEFARCVHSGNPADLEKALALLEENRAIVAKALGREVPGVDGLAEFPDLAEEVENGLITRARAVEVAAARRNQQAATRARETEDAGTQQQRRVDAGAAQVDSVVAELAKADPQHAAKMAILRPMLTAIARNTPPEAWAAAVRDAYAGVTVPAAPAPRQQAYQPLRPTAGGAGGGERPSAGPASMLDAISSALG